MNSNPTFLPQLASKSRPTIPHPLPQLCQKGPCPNVHVDALFLARFHMISSILLNPHLGLSENSVPLHPMVNDHYPSDFLNPLGCHFWQIFFFYDLFMI